MTLPIDSGNWKLDETATTVAFTIKNMIVRTVPGSFDMIEGTATIGSDLAGSTISATVDAGWCRRVRFGLSCARCDKSPGGCQ